MRKRWLLIAAAALTAVFAFGLVACGDDNEDKNGGETPASTEPAQTTEPSGTAAETTVTVNLTEYIIAPEPASVPAGRITFDAKNIGTENHEMVIIKATGTLPTKDDGSVDENAAGVEAVDEIEEFPRNTEESLTVDLEPGSYVLICNIVNTTADGTVVNHYAEGMYAAFEVTE